MQNQDYLAAILPKLKMPMPYKWRVQSFSKQKPEATCVAYIDARDVMDRLDDVCVYGWERSHAEIKGHIYSTVTIIMPDGSRISRTDCGTESQTEAEKGESSDSFKRAAVNWGVGRFLYDLEIKRLPANEAKDAKNYPYIVDNAGKRVWDITKHCNSSNPPKRNASPTPNPTHQGAQDANAMFTAAVKAMTNAKTMEELAGHYSAAKGLCSTQAELDNVVAVKDTRKAALQRLDAHANSGGQHDDAGDRA